MLKPSINTIVIGDVGSGKTIVAFIIGLNFLHSLEYGEVCMIAPTEILAFQHYQKLLELVFSQTKLFCDKDKIPYDEVDNRDIITVIYLAGKGCYINGEKLTRGKFAKKLEEIKNEVNSKNNLKHKFFWVGTHAILFDLSISPDLVMIDEQHRFGVHQRKKLAKRSLDLQPHFISFTATPIPRTLALTVYSSLKPHFLQSLVNRNPIKTRVLSFEKIDTEVLEQIKSTLGNGYKVYVVCPVVEETELKPSEKKDDKKPLWSIDKVSQLLEKYFPHQVLSVHGKMSEKQDILTEFKLSDDKNILVATTVIEVGVDVAEATLIIVFNAERFGLSALHQIRGRVGRNSYLDNFCVLLTEKEFIFSKRLKYLCQYNDGFKLAELDLELRGGGDLIGSSQSGFGDEIESIMGLNSQLYTQIAEIVATIDFQNIESELPRLYRYLEKEKNDVWEE